MTFHNKDAVVLGVQTMNPRGDAETVERGEGQRRGVLNPALHPDDHLFIGNVEERVENTQGCGMLPDAFGVLDGPEAPERRNLLQGRARVLPVRTVNIVFDGPPGPEGGRFLEVETLDGEGVSVGEWVELGDGLWALQLEIAE